MKIKRMFESLYKDLNCLIISGFNYRGIELTEETYPKFLVFRDNIKQYLLTLGYKESRDKDSRIIKIENLTTLLFKKWKMGINKYNTLRELDLPFCALSYIEKIQHLFSYKNLPTKKLLVKTLLNFEDFMKMIDEFICWSDFFNYHTKYEHSELDDLYYKEKGIRIRIDIRNLKDSDLMNLTATMSEEETNKFLSELPFDELEFLCKKYKDFNNKIMEDLERWNEKNKFNLMHVKKLKIRCMNQIKKERNNGK